VVGTTLTLVFALAVLICGADMLVRGAARLAAALGVSALVVGLTVVAFGTSAPEMAVSVASAVGGRPDLALGNVVGSNIVNVLVILGLSALIVPLVVNQQLVRLDVPLMLVISVSTAALARDGRVSPIEGGLLFAGAVAYTMLAIRLGCRESAAVEAEYQELEEALAGGAPRRGFREMAVEGMRIVFGLLLLVLGARWLVDAAATVARALGVGELTIGLTVVALGTSLPELATSVVAAWRNERDIAVGNVVGSNIFNLLAVLGLSAVVSPAGVAVSPVALRVDLPVMIVVTAVCLPVVASGRRIDRWEGGLLLAGYGLYIAYLVLAAGRHAALEDYVWWLTRVVLPVLLVAFAGPVLLQGFTSPQPGGLDGRAGPGGSSE
jgi:cation:H+ antiporter